MKKRLYIISGVFLITLLSFQTIKSSTQNQAVNIVEVEEELTAIDYRAEDNFKDFDGLTD